jgi:hypothetical protein
MMVVWEKVERQIDLAIQFGKDLLGVFTEPRRGRKLMSGYGSIVSDICPNSFQEVLLQD